MAVMIRFLKREDISMNEGNKSFFLRQQSNAMFIMINKILKMLKRQKQEEKL